MSFDAILVPGGGVRPGGRLPPWVRARLDRALSVERGELMVTLSAGTIHRAPPLDARGHPILESMAAAIYLVNHGITPSRILLDTSSYDTIGNAYFSRVVHAAPRHLLRLLVITSAFHMPRTEFIFNWVYGLPPNAGFELSFDAAEDEGIKRADLDARRHKEEAALSQLQVVAEEIRSLEEFHRWLFSQHGAYSALGHTRTARPPLTTY